MIAKSVNLVLHFLLKTLHDQERHNGGRQPDGDAGYGNFVYDGRETIALPLADSFGYEIRKVQRMFNFEKYSAKIKRNDQDLGVICFFVDGHHR